MDRNVVNQTIYAAKQTVATREGGVDRNIGYCLKTSTAVKVATREGGVDRNATNRALNTI